jgi:hypothetical protein
MADVTRWTKVAVAMQSALGSGQVIDSISKASPGVLAYQGADPANGDYFLLSAQGMREVHNRVVRVANVNAGSNTFELDELNTTGFTTFTSGTMYPLTLGTTFSTLLDWNSEGGEATFDDDSTIHDDIEILAPVRFSAIKYTSTSVWDPSDAALVAASLASDTKAQRAFLFTFSNGKKHGFYGYVGFPFVLGGQAPNKVTTPLTITSQGRASNWSD